MERKTRPARLRNKGMSSEGRGIRSTAPPSVYEPSRPGRRLGYRETYRIGCNSRQRTGAYPGRLLKDTDYAVHGKGGKKEAFLFPHCLSSSTDHLILSLCFHSRLSVLFPSVYFALYVEKWINHQIPQRAQQEPLLQGVRYFLQGYSVPAA